jgi:hypothetical protein
LINRDSSGGLPGTRSGCGNLSFSERRWSLCECQHRGAASSRQMPVNPTSEHPTFRPIGPKVSTPKSRQFRRNVPNISNGLTQSGMCEFDPSRPSHAFRPLVRPHKTRTKRPNFPAFHVFEFVSGSSVCRTRGRNRGKSPAVSANIPVLRRLSAETGLIATVARLGTLVWGDLRTEVEEIGNCSSRTSARPWHLHKSVLLLQLHGIGSRSPGLSPEGLWIRHTITGSS